MSPPSTAAALNPTATVSPSPPHVVEDCAGLIKLLSDGSIIRSPDPIFPTPIHQHRNATWKQIQFDSNHNLNLRIYKPRSQNTSKLPILFYFHGGGFCFGSCSWPHIHDCCANLASELDAVVVSPDYRLAPENRLPAAIQDGISALEWLRTHATSAAEPDGELFRLADIENVTVMGDSAGGLIAHHLAVRFGSADTRAELEPVRITKYVLLGPFFGGNRRTESEVECAKDAFLNLEVVDRFWRLSLPVGADRDDPVANPFAPESAKLMEAVGFGFGFGSMLIVVGGCDLLRDRGVDYGERLRKLGKSVEVVEFEGEGHGFLTDKPSSESAIELVGILKRFVR